ncbi:putative late blight resistance protein homolog R1A-3 [Sesamum indicum]|uniref:Late blight resistance protein homolog R1A-3 n=1 Tax=Sesamum indicum TaxID=4182 RepID=A0A6I9SS99_SESIN|nr:putative late blight resistance protein homolog R1A-3 [Sesamum indicum]
MAVAAYASLVSLRHVLDNVQHPARRHRLHLDTDQIQSLQEKVEFLQGFLELHSQRISPEMEDLAKQLAVVADEADDIIDFHVVNQLGERSQDQSLHMLALSSFCQDMDNIIEKLDSITEKLMMVKEEWVDVQEQQPMVSVSVGSTAVPSGDKNTMVGFDERLLQVVDELTRDESDLRILPIVGMGGIGKTTLARNTFDYPYIVNRFDIRIWFAISQQYSVREILLKYLINCENIEASAADDLDLAEVGEHMHKLLFGKRYLIVLDDLWSIKAWEDFKSSFPDNRNGSRILVTTRLLDVARPLGFDNHYLTLNLLDENKSWDLLCEKVFAQQSCPRQELEEMGRKIAKGCRGLPLAIVIIGGLLSKSNKTPEYWKFVEDNVTSFVRSGYDESCLKILSLSYNSLPLHLKPCFLYMRVFPEDDTIKASKLIKLWIGEGFLKPVQGKSLEEVAEEYLKDLTDRNLIFISKWTRSGRIKTCNIHDILRELCFMESNREHLIRVPKTQYISFPREPEESHDCFLCSDKLGRQIKIKQVFGGVASPSVCEACNNVYPNLNSLRWVKALELIYNQSFTFPHHTKLRCLEVNDYRCHDEYWITGELLLASTISLLWNLQILDVDLVYEFFDMLVVPSEVWEIPKLRHLKLGVHRLPDPLTNQLEGQESTVLENLSTLSSGAFKCSEEVVKRVPNMRELHANYMEFPQDNRYSLYNLARLDKLESLYVAYYSHLENIAFPTSLKKLDLSFCSIPWHKMTIIGSSLPNLEVFKLHDATTGQEWNPIEGEFLRLKTLSIWDCYLVRWGAEDVHFPNLQSLSLEKIRKLKEIPLSIGDINTLQSIHLDKCSESVINSAMEILNVQRENGNESLYVYVGGKQVTV